MKSTICKHHSGSWISSCWENLWVLGGRVDSHRKFCLWRVVCETRFLTRLVRLFLQGREKSKFYDQKADSLPGSVTETQMTCTKKKNKNGPRGFRVWDEIPILRILQRPWNIWSILYPKTFALRILIGQTSLINSFSIRAALMLVQLEFTGLR